jgi:DNA-binding transcriptional LysR family regulator
MPADVANLVLADTLAAFVALHPGITLELDLSPRRVDLLGEGFDAAVRIGALPDDGLLVARRLTVFAQGLYAAPGYLAERGEPLAPQDLADHDAVRLLGGDGGPVPWTLTRGTERWEGVPAGRAAANSPELLMRLVRAGAGIAAAPEVFARPLERRGELRRVLADWRLPSDTAWVVFPGRRLLPAKTRAFVDMLQAALGGPERPAGEPE